MKRKEYWILILGIVISSLLVVVISTQIDWYSDLRLALYMIPITIAVTALLIKVKNVTSLLVSVFAFTFLSLILIIAYTFIDLQIFTADYEGPVLILMLIMTIEFFIIFLIGGGIGISLSYIIRKLISKQNE